MPLLQPSRPEATDLPADDGRSTLVTFDDRSRLIFAVYLLWLENNDLFILEDGSELIIET